MWILFLIISVFGLVISMRASRIISAFVERAGVKEQLHSSTFPPYNGRYFGEMERKFYAKHADDQEPIARHRIGHVLHVVFLLLALFTSGLPEWLAGRRTKARVQKPK